MFQILVTDGNHLILPNSFPINALLPGQIGFFDFENNVSFDMSSPVPDKFYIAVGIDKDGDGVSDSFGFSAGQNIVKKEIKDHAFKNASAGSGATFNLSNFEVNCGEEYTVKFIFRDPLSNTPFTRAYSIQTSPCEGCVDCGVADCNEVLALLFKAINDDKDNMLTATALDDTGTVISDIDTFVNTHKAVNLDDDKTNNVCGSLDIQVNVEEIKNFCGINPRYHKIRIPFPTIVMENGFGTVVQTSSAVVSQGAGYDVKQKEYHAGGWNGRPGVYRILNADVTPNGYQYFADTSIYYNQYNLNYGNEQGNVFRTEIAIPVSDGATLASINPLILSIF